MVPRKLTSVAPHVDVTAAMDEQPRSRAVSLKVVSTHAPVETIRLPRSRCSDADVRPDPRRPSIPRSTRRA